jgi:hypothetical protein
MVLNGDLLLDPNDVRQAIANSRTIDAFAFIQTRSVTRLWHRGQLGAAVADTGLTFRQCPGPRSH